MDTFITNFKEFYVVYIYYRILTLEMTQKMHLYDYYTYFFPEVQISWKNVSLILRFHSLSVTQSSSYIWNLPTWSESNQGADR